MKIKYNPIGDSYHIVGVKKITLPYGSVSSVVDLWVEPQNMGIFFKYQKRRFSRVVRTVNDTDSARIRFNREAANLMMANVELEFDSANLPVRVTNHKAIWEKWLSDVDILYSKYNGEMVDRLINTMTIRLGDEKVFLECLARDFLLSELYQRQLHKITFDDKTYSCQRQFKETALNSPLWFDQQYTASITKDADRIEIVGTADIQTNKESLISLCKSDFLKLEDMVSIEQKSIYQAKNITYIPDKIISIFTIRGKDSILKQAEIELNIQKIDKP